MCNCKHCFQPAISEYDQFVIENQDLVNELVDIKFQIEAIKRKETSIRNELLNKMQRHHISRFETVDASVTAVADSTYSRIDSAKLKNKYPSAYHACYEFGYKDSYLVLKVK